MTTLRAHFDGRVLIPDEPVNLPAGTELTIHIEEVKVMSVGAVPSERPLLKLLEAIGGPIEDDGLPSDLAAQHDHYLYGTPKRP